MAEQMDTSAEPVQNIAEAGQVVEAPSQPSKDLRRWRNRVEAARKLRTDWERDYAVKECEEFYLGKQATGLPAGVKIINHFLATIRVTMPNLIFEEPKFLCRAKAGQRAPTSAFNEKVAEGVLESVAKQDDNLRNAARLGLLQNFFRIGVLKVVYDPSMVPNPSANEPVVQQDTEGNPILDDLGQPQPEVDPVSGQPIIEPPLIMSDETYRWEWVDARHVLLPDAGPDANKWPWVAEEIEVDLDDAKEDQRFPQHLRDKFRPAGKKEGDEDGYASDDDVGERDDRDECFRYIEIYDVRKRRWLILADQEDLNEFLVDDALPDGVEDHPYAIMPGWLAILGPKPSPWPLPYTNPWLDLQREYNISRQQQTEGGKRSARKILYEANTFQDEDEAVKAMQSAKDNEGVMVKDVNRPPVYMEDKPLNPAIYQSSNGILFDWRIITGQTGAKMGMGDADTATEATFVERASNLRDADLQKEVTKWLKVAGEKMLQRIRATLTLQMFVRIRGMNDKEIGLYLQSIYGLPPEVATMFPDLVQALIQRYGAEKVEHISREDLEAEVDIEVVPGSTRPKNLTTERQQLLEFLTLLANAPQLALSRQLLEIIASKFDQISDAAVDEIHALSMTMIQLTQSQAGRGGKGTASENSDGSEASSRNGNMSQASQGTEIM